MKAARPSALNGKQFGEEIGQIVLHPVPAQQKADMRRGDETHQDAEVPPVVQERQESRAEPRQRPDAENDRQHQEGTGAGRPDADIDRVRQVFWRKQAPDDRAVNRHIGRNGGQQDGVVDQLVAIPLNGAEADAHQSFLG